MAAAMPPLTPNLAQEIPALAFLYPFEIENQYVSLTFSIDAYPRCRDAHATR